jgi:hypothetical protein
MDFTRTRPKTYMAMSSVTVNAVTVCHIGNSVGVARRKSGCFWTERTQPVLAPKYACVHMVQAHTESIQHPTHILSIPLRRICLIGRAQPFHRRRHHSHFDSYATRVRTRILTALHSTRTFSKTIDAMASRKHLRRHYVHLSTNARQHILVHFVTTIYYVYTGITPMVCLHTNIPRMQATHRQA